MASEIEELKKELDYLKGKRSSVKQDIKVTRKRLKKLEGPSKRHQSKRKYDERWRTALRDIDQLERKMNDLRSLIGFELGDSTVLLKPDEPSPVRDLPPLEMSNDDRSKFVMNSLLQYRRATREWLLNEICRLNDVYSVISIQKKAQEDNDANKARIDRHVKLAIDCCKNAEQRRVLMEVLKSSS